MKENTMRTIPAGFVLLALLLSPVPIWAQEADAPPDSVPRLFHTADQCMACHNQLTASSGEDVSIGFDWRSSMMGNSGRDPYWMASVRRETLDHSGLVDAIEDKCSICHLAMARAQSVADGGQGRIFRNLPPGEGTGPYAHLAADGVSCSACHQIQDEKLGTEESFTGGFVIDHTTPMGERVAFGPFEVDEGRTRVMSSASQFHPQVGDHVQSAELCATCHTLYTNARNPQGEVVGQLPEQVPYLEWQHSDYVEDEPCQSCHMPLIQDSVSVAGVLVNPRAEVNRHTFRGGNFLMPRMLNRYRGEMGTAALPQELEATAGQALDNLRNHSATVTVDPVGLQDGRLDVDVLVENLAGHKLPTAYPSRRAWLHVTVKDRGGDVVFESGALRPDGSIVGNDNDTDATRYEPHYVEIDGPDQVQIYEPVMVDYAGEVTTGLLWGMKYIKDNRILPLGFDKETAVYDVAVQGEAAEDHDFQGGMDKVRYAVDVGSNPGPFTVEAELWYQPIGFRWARNLAEYETAESARFNRYFEGMSESVSALLARGHVRIEVSQEEAKPTT
jgi:hypothetical protein